MSDESNKSSDDDLARIAEHNKRMLDAIDAHLKSEPTSDDVRAQKILEDVKATVRDDSTIEEGTTVFHYTNIHGFMGIIKSKSIWATNIKYLNDASEVSYARSVINQVLDKHYGVENNDPDFVRLLNVLRALVKTEESIPDIYVACFCTSGDLLSQWKGYGEGGAGVSIGIDVNRIKKLRSRDPRRSLPFNVGRFSLVQILYDENEQWEKINDLITTAKQALGECKSLPDPVCSNTQFQLRILLTRIFSTFLYTFKHPSFEQERELRLVVHPQEANDNIKEIVRVFEEQMKQPAESHSEPFEIMFRASPKRIVPYVALKIFGYIDENDKRNGGWVDDEDLKPNEALIPVKQVICGPTQHPTLGKASVKAYLKSWGYKENVRVDNSNVPLAPD